jgi:hypothetical protein
LPAYPSALLTVFLIQYNLFINDRPQQFLDGLVVRISACQSITSAGGEFLVQSLINPSTNIESDQGSIRETPTHKLTIVILTSISLSRRNYVVFWNLLWPRDAELQPWHGMMFKDSEPTDDSIQHPA